MLLDLKKSALTEELDYNFLKYMLNDYKNPRVKINDLLKKEQIIRVKKGLYVLGPELARKPYSKETLANLIYGPSYLSLEYALYFYGMIPDRVETVTSVTNKRNKLFKTPLGVFSYKYISPSIFSYGVTLYEIEKNHSILIATKEKALADMLYFADTMIDQTQIEQYLFENMRLDQEDLLGLDMRKIKQLAANYGHNVNLFYKLLESINE